MKIAYRYRLANRGRRRQRQRTGAHGKKEIYGLYVMSDVSPWHRPRQTIKYIFIPAQENRSAPTTQRQRHSKSAGTHNETRIKRGKEYTALFICFEDLQLLYLCNVLGPEMNANGRARGELSGWIGLCSL